MKKLRLSRETLRTLDPRDIDRVAGGLLNPKPSWVDRCETMVTCIANSGCCPPTLTAPPTLYC